MFLLICSGRIGGQFLSTNMAPPKLYKGSWNISANNSETVATKAWDLDKLFVYYSFITFHFVGFFYWTVSNAINTAQKKYDARLRDSENKECVPVFSKKKKKIPYYRMLRFDSAFFLTSKQNVENNDDNNNTADNNNR